ncbi:MAG: hypothetical protein HY683_09370 [Chloroflexi bacterium]|nr:hypothetical protein [Chloroflexota bacterium]
MGGFGTLSFWLAWRRLRASWPLLAAAAFAVLLSVTLVAAAAIASRTVSQAGLDYALSTADPRILDAQVVVRERPLGLPDYQRLRGRLEPTAQGRLGDLLREVQRYGGTPEMPMGEAPGRYPPPGPYAGQLFFLSDFAAHSRLVEGRWPSVPSAAGPGPNELEVALGRQAAEELRWSVGAQAYLYPLRLDDQQYLPVRVVGLVEPLDPDDEFWLASLRYFYVQELPNQVLVSFYLPEEAFFAGAGARFPSLLGTYWWFLYLRPRMVAAGTVASTLLALDRLETDINQAVPRSLVFTALDVSLRDYQRRWAQTQVPLFLFISLTAVVLLYYLLQVTGMLAASRSREAALLRSRGATHRQVSAFLGLGEGLLVTLPAAAAGPFLALLLVGHVPGLRPVTGDAVVGLTPAAFIVAGAVGLLCLVAFLATSWHVARGGTLATLRALARPPAVPWFLRYYLDLLVLAALAYLWWQLRGRGGFLTQRAFGEGLEVEPLVLLAPALALLAAGLLALRVFPLLARLLAWLGERWRAAWLVQGVRHLARDPLAYTSLAVLLLLAVALGTFVATFGATISQTHRDQARYAIGGDMVVSSPLSELLGTKLALEDALPRIPGVEVASPVYRSVVTVLVGQSGTNANILAVRPDTLPQVTKLRADFARKGLATLMAPLRSELPATAGVRVPDNAEQLGLWVRPSRPMPSVRVWLQVKDAGGQRHELPLGSPSENAWMLLLAPLEQIQIRGAPTPLSVTAVYITATSLVDAGPGALLFDDILDGLPQGVPPNVLEGFEGQSPWDAFPLLSGAKDTLEVGPQAAHSGQAGLSFAWSEPLSNQPRGAFIPPVSLPLKAVGGPGFQEGQNLVLSMQGRPVPVVITDTVRYFPTLYPARGPFMVLGLDSLDTYLSSLPFTGGLSPDEYWLALSPSADRGAARKEITKVLPLGGQVRDSVQEVRRLAGDPLIAGGWRGLGLLALIGLGGALVLGWALHSALMVQQSRTELVVLRALGFSGRQVGLLLGAEALAVAATGIVAGFGLGTWLGRWTLGYVRLTAGSAPPVPPPVLAQDGLLTALTYGAVVLALATGTGLAILLALHLRMPEVLREEP